MMRLNADLRGLVHLGRMSGGYFFTTLINNAIPFLFLPVLTRYLSPAEYANIALFSFYLAISNSLGRHFNSRRSSPKTFLINPKNLSEKSLVTQF